MATNLYSDTVIQTNRMPYFAAVIKKTVIKIQRTFSLIDFATA